MKNFKILFLSLFLVKATAAISSEAVTFGNAVYVNLSVGEKFNYLGKTIEVVALKNHLTQIKVERDTAWLKVARRLLPTEIGGLRVFVSDQINVKNLTTDPEKHNLLQKDVLLSISDPSKPLLDPYKFTFPISNRDGYEWMMEEDSHMFAYLGANEWFGLDYFRSHEGIDMNMHEARGKEIHPLVAIEDATVILVADSTVTKSYDGCIILKSDSQKDIFYVYKHTNPRTHKVKEGQKVKKGDVLSYIWGDNVWGHLHFAIVHRTDTPGYNDRYTNLLNVFPQMYEVDNGHLKTKKNVRNEGHFTFGHRKQLCRNFKRLDEYNELIGYGWKLGEWCKPQRVESVESDWGGNARLNKVLYSNSKAESENPKSYFDFEVDVENGIYEVNAIIGDSFAPTSQKLFFEDKEIGTFKVNKGEYKKTDSFKVNVKDNKLTVRLELTDDETTAGINELNFKKISSK